MEVEDIETNSLVYDFEMSPDLSEGQTNHCLLLPTEPHKDNLEAGIPEVQHGASGPFDPFIKRKTRFSFHATLNTILIVTLFAISVIGFVCCGLKDHATRAHSEKTTTQLNESTQERIDQAVYEYSQQVEANITRLNSLYLTHGKNVNMSLLDLALLVESI